MSFESEQYDNWYYTPRGTWIGNCETKLLFDALRPELGESLLDVGCGTGYFTRRMTQRIGGNVIGIDINEKWVRFAYKKGLGKTFYAVADARKLPFGDAAFDMVISVAAICFIPNIRAAISEIIRVTRRCFAIGLLNRHSLLWLKKGKSGGSGSYRGARWHSVNEVLYMFDGLPVKNLIAQTAVHIPSGGKIAQWFERFLPSNLQTGAFILIRGDVVR